MENKTVVDEIMQDFGLLLDKFSRFDYWPIEKKGLYGGLKKILEKRLGETRVLYDSEKLAEDMAHDTTFGWFPDDEPHPSTCACGECLDRAADEKG